VRREKGKGKGIISSRRVVTNRKKGHFLGKGPEHNEEIGGERELRIQFIRFGDPGDKTNGRSSKPS